MRKLYIILTMIFLLTGMSFSQGIKLGVGGGLSFMQGDYYSSLGMDRSYHVGLKAKLDIPLLPITPVAYFNYHFLSGTYNIPFTTLSIEPTQNYMQLAVGGEMSLLPGPLSPYLGLDLVFNNFSEFKVNSGPLNNQSGFSRVGLAIGAGLELGGIFPINLDASIKYHLLNILGKEDGELTRGAVAVNLVLLF
jgi:hypothetical protein